MLGSPPETIVAQDENEIDTITVAKSNTKDFIFFIMIML
jgi:hypothetical protein